MKLLKSQLEKLSDICADIAQVSLATVIIPVAIDKFDGQLLLFGCVVCVVFWFLSVYLRR